MGEEEDRAVNIDLGDFVLRKPKDSDADGFIRICSDKDAMRYYGIAGSDIKTPEDAQDQIDWCNSLFEKNAGRWIITEKGRDEYIGDIGFFNFDQSSSKAEIGFRLMREYWNRGIASKAVSELLNVGFGVLKYNRVEAFVDSRNEGSRRVLMKNCFVHEGRLRQSEFENNEYIDIDVFSILKEEYKGA
jgi:[ribosomal protein S5]-alanine N-acetyltransferase